MTTVINNPGGNETPVIAQPSGVGPVVAIIIAAVAVVLFFLYILPMMRSAQSVKSNGIDVNIKLPTPTPPANNTNSAPAY